MWSGIQSSSSPRAANVARSAASRPPFRKYHWRLVTISSGLSPFSKNLTGWVILEGSPTSAPDSVSSSTILALAVNTVVPASDSYAATASAPAPTIQVGVSARTRPSRPRIARVGRSSSRHQVTSVVSPKVQIMAMPEPLSGSASSWASTGTSTPKTGVRTLVPNSGW